LNMLACSSVHVCASKLLLLLLLLLLRHVVHLIARGEAIVRPFGPEGSAQLTEYRVAGVQRPSCVGACGQEEHACDSKEGCAKLQHDVLQLAL
jgi:hypothetical protein